MDKKKLIAKFELSDFDESNIVFYKRRTFRKLTKVTKDLFPRFLKPVEVVRNSVTYRIPAEYPDYAISEAGGGT